MLVADGSASREDRVTTPEACIMCLVTSDAPLPVLQATVLVAPWVFRANLRRIVRRAHRRLKVRRRAMQRARRSPLP
jgi:hypothetical protein